MMRSRFTSPAAWLAMLVSLYLAGTPAALAVPSFARQTGMACEACHTIFPELTHFGRLFKANGYTLSSLKQVRDVDARKSELLALSQFPPLSIMMQVSYTELKKTLPDYSTGGTNDKALNGTVAFPQQLSLFYAGEIAPHLGAFIQFTYGNDSGTFGIDNTDLRFANLAVLSGDQSLIYGVSLNNNPTVQDLWNSTPAFGFPYQASNSLVSPLAGAQIDGTLGQSVAGLSGYLFWNESLYAELGVYRSAQQGAANSVTGAAGPLDGTTSNVISGAAPYWRVAYEYNVGRHSIEVGAYGLDVKFFPGSTTGTPLSGKTNRFNDVAEDVQYQYLGDEHLFSVAATRIHESMSLDASYEAEQVANKSNDLTTFRLTGTYYYRRMIGGSLGYFQTTGSSDAGLYPAPAESIDQGPIGVVTSANNRPDTKGWVAEVNYVPWLNTKFTLQYTGYSKFNGGSNNYDGAGRNASDNNSLYLLVWFSY
ncbi:MAG TPA: hypothetical protein VMT50_06510 [Steroidobacteraceae bacterium]|nr:hypothetical protein [Steroidobacteraceae bacterium]